jgi:membrane associated rhomboid family serine protease
VDASTTMIPLTDDIRRESAPAITIVMVAANLVAYALAAHGGSLIGGPSDATVVRYGAIPYELSHWGKHCELGLALLKQVLLCTGQHGVIGTAAPQPATWETAFTAMLVHANVVALAVNMVFLAVFGASVEGRLGHRAFLGLSLAGGLAALALQVAVHPDATAPTLGASGAVAAVLGAYVVLHPRARVRTLVPAITRVALVELPAPALVAAWFAFDAILGALGLATRFGGDATGALSAHGGAFALGALVALASRGRQRGLATDQQVPG